MSFPSPPSFNLNRYSLNRLLVEGLTSLPSSSQPTASPQLPSSQLRPKNLSNLACLLYPQPLKPHTLTLFLYSAFLTHNLPAFSAASPATTIHVSPRPGIHPVIRAHYIAPSPTSPSTFSPPITPSNGTTITKAICVRNLSKEQILQKAELLRDGNGAKNRRVTGGRVVKSGNDGVRGIWSPMHGTESPLRGMRREG